jgi:hypothetical protein
MLNINTEQSQKVATKWLQQYCQQYTIPIISYDIYSYNSNQVPLQSVGIIWITCFNAQKMNNIQIL